MPSDQSTTKSSPTPLTQQIDTEGGLCLSEPRAELLVEAIEDSTREKERIVEEFYELKGEFEGYRRHMEAKLLVARPLYFLLGAAVAGVFFQTGVVFHV